MTQRLTVVTKRITGVHLPVARSKFLIKLILLAVSSSPRLISRIPVSDGRHDVAIHRLPGRKIIVSRLTPVLWSDTPSQPDVFNFLDKLPVLCLEFQNYSLLNYQLLVTGFIFLEILR